MLTAEEIQRARASVAAMTEDEFYAACLAAGIAYQGNAWHLEQIKGGKR